MTRLQHGVALGRAPHGDQPEQHAGRAADALERGEGEALELAVDPGAAGEDPVLLRLRQLADLEAGRHRWRTCRPSRQLRVGERRAVLGLDLDRHVPTAPEGARAPASSTGDDGWSWPGLAPGRRSHFAIFRGESSHSPRVGVRATARSERDGVGAEGHAQLADDPRQVDAVVVGQAQHLPRRGAGTPAIARVLAEQPLERRRCAPRSGSSAGSLRRSGGAPSAMASSTVSSRHISLGVSSRPSTRPFTPRRRRLRACGRGRASSSGRP